MSKKRKSAFDKISIKKKDEQVEEPPSHSIQEIDAIDWDALIQKNQPMALALLTNFPHKISQMDKLKFLQSPIEAVRLSTFAGIENAIVNNTLVEADDPIWRMLLRYEAENYFFKETGVIHFVFLSLCCSNYYRDDEIEDVDWEEYAFASYGNSKFLPEGVLEWFRERMTDPSENYIKHAGTTLQKPNANKIYSPEEINFMQAQVAAWENKKLNERVAEVLEQTKPSVSAL